MYTKLILATLCSLALAAPQHPPAAQYPAGVNPQDCPGFPICDNARLHNPHAQNWGAPAPAWNHQPAANHWNQWNQGGHDNGQWNGGHDNGQWNGGHDDGQWNPAHDDGQWNQWNDNGQDHGQWNQGQWNHGAPAAAPAPVWNQHQAGGHGGAPGGADKYPAGVNPHACPNYPFCDLNAAGHHAPAVQPLPGWNERVYPAGVSAHECPNFPYCH